jgi:hypothetical protein
MAYVPGYEHDIFVSYAHVDNHAEMDSAPGWATKLVDGLKTQLAKKLGRRDAFDLWMDRKLTGNEPFTPEIMQGLQNSATILIIFSPGYMASEWCQQELASFLEEVQSRVRPDSRIFLVECEPVDIDSRPPQVRDLLGYPFWVCDDGDQTPHTLGWPQPTSDDIQYWKRLAKLSQEIANELNELKKVEGEDNPQQTHEHGAGVRAVPADSDRPAVFLAESTDDLADLREDVANYLDQAGFQVVPHSAVRYPYELDEYCGAVDRDLTGCGNVFVQLLSGVAGRKPPGSDKRYIVLQHERARAAKLEILQWRSRELDLESITDADYRACLENATVQAVGLEEFKQTVVNRIKSSLAAPEVAEDSPFVRISADPDDQLLKETIAETLHKYNVCYDAADADDIVEDMEYVIDYCDGLIILSGNTAPRRVDLRLRECRKMFRRKTPLGLAVYQGPPDKPAPRVRLPGMRIINGGETGVNEAELLSFVDNVRITTKRSVSGVV